MKPIIILDEGAMKDLQPAGISDDWPKMEGAIGAISPDWDV